MTTDAYGDAYIRTYNHNVNFLFYGYRLSF